jgi:hypothetical protein
MRIRVNINKLLSEQKDSVSPAQDKDEEEVSSTYEDFAMWAGLDPMVPAGTSKEMEETAKKLAREKLRAVTGSSKGSADNLAEIQLYLGLFSDPEILSDFFVAAATGPEAYNRFVNNLGRKIESDTYWTAAGNAVGPAAIEAAALAFTGFLGGVLLGALSFGTEESSRLTGKIHAVGIWTTENFKQFAHAMYPLLLWMLETGKPRTSKYIRNLADDLVPGNLLGDFAYDPPSYFPLIGSSIGGHQEVTDARIMWQSIDGFGTWEDDIEEIMKRRSKIPGDLVNLYNEFNQYLYKDGKAEPFKKGGGIAGSVTAGRGKIPGFKNRRQFQIFMKGAGINLINYYSDLIDWLWNDGMYKESIEMMTALARNNLMRSVPPAAARSVVEDFDAAQEEEREDYDQKNLASAPSGRDPT